MGGENRNCWVSDLSWLGLSPLHQAGLFEHVHALMGRVQA